MTKFDLQIGGSFSKAVPKRKGSAQSWSAQKDDKSAKRDARSLSAAKPAVTLSVVELIRDQFYACWTRVRLNRQ